MANPTAEWKGFGARKKKKKQGVVRNEESGFTDFLCERLQEKERAEKNDYSKIGVLSILQ